jgi:hypothetical protein
MKKFNWIFFLLLLAFSNKTESYEGDGRGVIMYDCNTSDDENIVFDLAKTKITFYGDSRMDFVNTPGYGNSSMDRILNEPYNGVPVPSDQAFSFENIQNLSVGGWESWQVRQHVEECFKEKYSKNYKTAKRFVVHAGGNNLIVAAIASYHAYKFMSKTAYGRALLPLTIAVYFEFTKENIRTDMRAILDQLNTPASNTATGKTDILVVGGYPAKHWYSPFPGSTSTPGSTPKLKELNPLQAYLDYGLYLTLGLYQLESDYSSIANSHNAYFISVWDAMSTEDYMLFDLIHPNEAGFKKWGSVVGNKLREIKFNSTIVPKTITSTGNRWKDAESQYQFVKDDLEIKLADYEAKKAELKIRLDKLKEIEDQVRDAQYKLSLINQRIDKLDGQIADTKAKISSLNDQIADARLQGRLEEEQILAEQIRQAQEILNQQELERQQAEAARIEQERQNAILAQQQAEAARQLEITRQQEEAARLALEDAKKKEQLAKAAAEAEAKRAEDEKRRNEAILLCFFLKVCK